MVMVSTYADTVADLTNKEIGLRAQAVTPAQNYNTIVAKIDIFTKERRATRCRNDHQSWRRYQNKKKQAGKLKVEQNIGIRDDKLSQRSQKTKKQFVTIVTLHDSQYHSCTCERDTNELRLKDRCGRRYAMQTLRIVELTKMSYQCTDR